MQLSFAINYEWCSASDARAFTGFEASAKDFSLLLSHSIKEGGIYIRT
jgi:hypothetical protein